MSEQELITLAERMGLQGAELKTWVDARLERAHEESVQAREERSAERQAAKERLEIEERTLQLRIRLAEVEGSREPTARDREPERSQSRPCLINPHNLIPVFDEGRDDLDAYLKRFERVAVGQEWPEEKWATALSLCLSGEALKVFGRLSPEDSLDYQSTKMALLQRFRFTAEGYREKFRQSKPEDGETGKQYATRLQSYFDRWLEMSETDEDFASVRNLIVAEQFLNNCHDRLALFLREKKCRTVKEMAEAADTFLEAQRQTNLLVFRTKSANNIPKEQEGFTYTQPPLRCFVCDRPGHRASDCRTKPQRVFCGHCRKPGHDARACPSNGGSKKMTSCIVSTDQKSETPRCADDSSQDEYVASALRTRTATATRNLPVLQGEVFGHTVSVLRDTGSNTLVVRRSLVPDDALTGTTATILLADGSCIEVPEAEVRILSPYFTGNAIVKCMTSPLYDVIVGNVPGARDANDPDSTWKESASLKSETNQALNSEEKSKDGCGTNSTVMVGVSSKGHRRKLTTAKFGNLEVTQESFRQKQEEDRSLDVCRAKVDTLIRGKGATYHSFMFEKGILYRVYHLTPGKSVQQAVVPKALRVHVLHLAHESPISGHQGIKKTKDRVLESFYWPGVQEEVRRFVKSCDACQRTYPKGKVGKAPLGRMPLIDTPFERVAVDIIGPLTPISKKGNRYILTLVDFATRYPDAVALPAIDSATVADGLLEMFSRIGFPREILCDQASCFTSGLMEEVNALLAIRHLSSTPYHPICNGLVERFNGTLKQMLRKLCQEKPKSWDRFLAPLLFAYREVPQASMGFSPFELIYGRHVRGPLDILKELWTGEDLEEDIKTTYGYVLDLRERLERTLKLAQENLSRAQHSQKKYYDRTSKTRQLKVGDRALILLPTRENKLLMHWKGPFPVTGKKNDHDYWLDLGHTTKMFHINMLKRYEERQPEVTSQASSFVVVEEGESDSPLPTFKVNEGKGIESVTLGSNLDEAQRDDMCNLLEEFRDIFSEVPGKTNLLECRLELTTTKPISTSQYPLPFAMKEIVEKEVQDMLKLGVIERSHSPYNSPLVLVKKPDNSFRACIDFRHINEVLVSDAEPIPRTDIMFAEVGTKSVFSKLDLTKGYWQVPLEESSRPKTAFSTQSGHYHFLYMPFGIKTASAIFTRLMRTLLHGIPNTVHYIDDVLIATATWEEHLVTLKQLFQRIREAGLRIKPQKCEIGMTSVIFLGHHLGDGTIRPVESTIAKIAKAPRPETKKQLRSFLGLAGYYRDLIPHYAQKAKPLTEMTRKMEKNKLAWNTEREEAFETLKQALASMPVVKAADIKKPFVLRTDASDRCIGAVLMQEHEGLLHPVSYASRQLMPREERYSAIERECLALVWAIAKFHIFLYGTSFVVQTDHQPLRYLSQAKHLNSRILRWSLALQEYTFRVEHIKGSENVGADYMSRLQV